MSNNVYVIEYAKSGRSGCKSKSHTKDETDKTIGKETIRIGKVYPSNRFGDDDIATDYYHPECFFETQLRARKTTKKVDDKDDLEGFELLSSKDQKYIMGLLENQRQILLSKGSKKKKTTTTKKKEEPKAKKIQNFLFFGSDDEQDDDKHSKSNNNNNNNNGKNQQQQQHHQQQQKPNQTPTKKFKPFDIHKALSPKWLKELDQDFVKKFNLDTFLNGNERHSKYLPSSNSVLFSAFNRIGSPTNCKVVVMGQHPMNDRNSASGFAFCDQSATTWKLDCRAPTRNLIKAAMLSNGFISKDDDLTSIREALREVTLPADSARDWFKKTGKQGVLWLNTALTCTEGDEDDNKVHEQVWTPVIEEFIRALFKVKSEEQDIKGIVFVLLGKHSHNWKEFIFNLHSEVMGVVPIEIIDGVSPSLETFHTVNVLSQINQLLDRVGFTTQIDWFPPKDDEHDDDYEEEEEEEEEVEEEEIKNNNNNNNNNGNYKTSTSPDNEKKSSSSQSSQQHNVNNSKADDSTTNSGSSGDILANLIQEDGKPIELIDGHEILLGRKTLLIHDAHVSRNQAHIVAKRVGGKVHVELTPLGNNPMYLIKNGEEELVQLEVDIPIQVHHKDTFLLATKKYPFIVELVNPASGVGRSSNNNSGVKKSSSQSSQSSSSTTTTTTTSTGKSKYNFFDQDEDNNNNNNQNTGSYSNSNVKKNKYDFDDDQDRDKQESDDYAMAKKLQDQENEKKRKTSDKSSSKTPIKTKQQPTKKKKKEKFVVDDDEDDIDDYYEDPSDEDYQPGEDEDDEDDYVPPKTRSSEKEKCRYWDKCYRKNKEHLEQFRHPPNHFVDNDD